MRIDMTNWVLVMVAAACALLGFAAISYAATWIVLRVARSRNHLDVPNDRSSHAAPTPRSGGLGIVATSGALLVMFSPELPLLWLVAGVAIACGVGFWDDCRTLRPGLKMLGLVAAAIVVAQLQPVRTVLAVPYAGDIDLEMAAWPLTLFWLACYPNAFNFMDGLNGIATLTTIVSASAFAVAGEMGHDSVLSLTGAVIAAAALGFLPWNFPRARIFMGDAGSLPLGLVLAWCAVRANASGALPFPASILLLGPFLFDVTFTLARRASEGKTLGAPHKEHLYQRLSRVWNSHAKVSLLYAGFSVVTGVLALSYASLSELGKLLSLALPLAAMLGFAAYVLRAERQKGR